MKKPCCLVFFSLSVAATLGGQTFEVSPVYGWVRSNKAPLGYASAVEGKDTDTTLRNGYTYGMRITVNSAGYYGHELTFVQTQARLRTVFQDSETSPRRTREGRVLLRQLSYNFLAYWMPRNERFRPFFTVGLEGRRSGRPDIAGWPTRPTPNYGVNYGWGIKIRLHSHALIRLDLRDTITGKPYGLQYTDPRLADGHIRQQQALLGVGITF